MEDSATRFFLKELGLSSFEQRAYLYILKAGTLTAQEISKAADVPMGRIYTVLNELEAKGLIQAHRLEKPIQYFATDPAIALGNLLNRRKEAFDERIISIGKAIENLVTRRDVIPTDEPEPRWQIYYGDTVAYEQVIPKLLRRSENEIIIIGRNVSRTLTPEFMKETVQALDRGVSFKGVLPTEMDQAFLTYDEGLEEAFGLRNLVKVVSRYWGRTLVLRKHPLVGVTPFGIFDRSTVGFSVTSPSGGRYLITLVTGDRGVVDEFLTLFRSIWDSSEEFRFLELLYGLLKERLARP